MMPKQKPTIAEFEEWIKDNYKSRPLNGPPDDWKRDKELYYKIAGLYYGPIQYEDIPHKYR